MREVLLCPRIVDSSGSGGFDGVRNVLGFLVADDGVDGSGSGGFDGTRDVLGCLKA